MSEFGRSIPKLGWLALESLARQPGENWWKGLLALWRPSGTPVGDHGLRAAFRNESMNFYRYGQSVARIKFLKNGDPVARLHAKYVGHDPAVGRDVRIAGTGTSRGRGPAMYENFDTLKAWIVAAEKKSGAEKRWVDDIVEQNPGLIDLEMTLPLRPEVTGATRIDVVSLEGEDTDVCVAFWEVKLHSDPRIWCVNAKRESTIPKVLEQLGAYDTFMSDDQRVRLVLDGVRSTCEMLLRLRDMAARSVQPDVMVSGLIESVGNGSADVVIDRKVRLAVCVEDRSSAGHWAIHESGLLGHGIPLAVLNRSSSRLALPERRL